MFDVSHDAIAGKPRRRKATCRLDDRDRCGAGVGFSLEANMDAYRDGYRQGSRGVSAISRPAMSKTDEANWLAGWTQGVKEFRRSLPRLGSAFETAGMRKGADARRVSGKAGY